MKFDHLDDDRPIEPTDSMRESVARRAGALRRRRMVVPGTALVAAMALAIAAVAVVANDTDAPRRVVAGPTAGGPGAIERSMTRNGATITVSLASAEVRPGSPVHATVTVRNGTDEPHDYDFRTCLATTETWTEFGECQRARLSVEPGAEASSSTTLEAPREPGDYLVGISDGAPSGEDWRLDVPLRVEGDVSAETLTARIELDADTVVAGGELHGELVIDNPTNETIDVRDGGCSSKWGVDLVRPGEEPDIAFTLECRNEPLRLPPGTTRFPFDVRATHGVCTNNRPSAEVPACLDEGGAPPLPPGDYEAAFDSLGDVSSLEPSNRVPVTVTSAGGEPTPSGTTTAIPCAPGREATGRPSPQHPERAPLIDAQSFANGVRWALCGAATTGEATILNVRSTDSGRNWVATDTGFHMSTHHAGDAVTVTFTDATQARVRLLSYVGERDDTYETGDGGATWELVRSVEPGPYPTNE
jgi:hypothetical protein